MGALTHNGEVLQSLPANASQINFNKTGTNLNSTQVENAIKEVNGKVNTNTDDITQLKSGLTGLITRTISQITTDQFKHVSAGKANVLLQVNFYNQSGYNIDYKLYTYLDTVMAELPEASTTYTMCKFEYNG